MFILDEYCARYGVRGCHRHLCYLADLLERAENGIMIDPTLLHYSYAFCASHVVGNRSVDLWIKLKPLYISNLVFFVKHWTFKFKLVIDSFSMIELTSLSFIFSSIFKSAKPFFTINYYLQILFFTILHLLQFFQQEVI